MLHFLSFSLEKNIKMITDMNINTLEACAAQSTPVLK